ncbi:hypothetical protein PaecuDRAFT_4408 [Paenibacillus curdlanolyticus YK9]|uniref:Uncharacterized protein n=1 Tax=Paenibacillus curdlanolyticus YK9 TaxID=717606 RepID=E0IFG7_9BACL|nr:hypothetical protein [Paenibacillus curdlanolyticus]EFM08943.1 hypothetical protein PaecuDRAFT_4408 [Paenibacillus curdlanolyticus YK9]
MSAKKDSKDHIEEIFMRDTDLESLRLTDAEMPQKKEEGGYEYGIVNAICQPGYYNDSFHLYDAYYLMLFVLSLVKRSPHLG